MEERKDYISPQEKDRHLDIPEEANRDNHINFLDVEFPENQAESQKSEETKERQRQWQQGIEEGIKERDNP